jgi:hypothetical protein
MADTYCGTLSLEYKHLQQQDEMAWMQQRFESRQPLTNTQRRQVRSEGACWCGEIFSNSCPSRARHANRLQRHCAAQLCITSRLAACCAGAALAAGSPWV